MPAIKCSLWMRGLNEEKTEWPCTLSIDITKYFIENFKQLLISIVNNFFNKYKQNVP